MKKLLFLFLLCLCFGSVQAQRKIILKLDDVSVKKEKCQSTPVMDVLASMKVKASFGVIPSRCDKTFYKVMKPYSTLLDKEGNLLFEFWSHGYEHKFPEFTQNPYEFQKEHFDKSFQMIEELFHHEVKISAFGAPYNKVDSVTARVIRENKDCKYVFFVKKEILNNDNIIYLNNRVNIENGTGKIDCDFFIQNYDKYKEKYKDLMVLQGHPNKWDAAKIEELKKIIKFLQDEGCVFVLPRDIK